MVDLVPTLNAIQIENINKVPVLKHAQRMQNTGDKSYLLIEETQETVNQQGSATLATVLTVLKTSHHQGPILLFKDTLVKVVVWSRSAYNHAF